eukprot:5152800-Pyramimonas_sp.AAC.1
MHWGEASERSVQLVEQNRQEKERAAEGDEKEPAAKPPGIPFSMDKKKFSRPRKGICEAREDLLSAAP